MAIIESQILNKVLSTGDMSIIVDNCLTNDFFPSYKDEFDYLLKCYNDYNQTPDQVTFLSKFPTFDLFEVDMPDSYLLDTIKESHVFSEVAKAINQSTDALKENSYKGMEILLSKINQIQMETGFACTDIVKDADDRYNAYNQKLLGDLNFYIDTGFPELDKVTNGWQRGEEFVVITARTGIGKSWFLIASATKAWENGYRVGFISPEMTANSVGYRFDTIRGHFSNQDLTFGKKIEGYDKYIESLKEHNNGFYVATPKDFQNRTTVSKLKVFAKLNKLDMLCIDGISYLQDERASRSDNRTMELTHISEDLMQLSNELKIPVLTVVQSNRVAVQNKDEAPDLESIRDSDGIAYNATRVLALRQAGGSTVEIRIRKNRYGFTGGKLCYNWDAEHGNFIYLPVEDDAISYKSNDSSEGTNELTFNKPNMPTISTQSSFIKGDASDVF